MYYWYCWARIEGLETQQHHTTLLLQSFSAGVWQHSNILFSATKTDFMRIIKNQSWQHFPTTKSKKKFWNIKWGCIKKNSKKKLKTFKQESTQKTADQTSLLSLFCCWISHSVGKRGSDGVTWICCIKKCWSNWKVCPCWGQYCVFTTKP